MRTWATIEPEDELACRSPLPVEHFADISPRVEGRWLIKRLLRSGAATVVFGFPGCGKSFLVLDWSLRIAAGMECFGRRVNQGTVIYIAAEGQGGVRARVEAFKREHSLQGREIPFVMVPTSVDLFDPKIGDVEKLREVFAQQFRRWGSIDEVVIDTLNATIGAGDENGPDMGVLVGNVKRLCEPYNSGWLIVTHVPLNGDAKRPRGHGSLWGATDTAIHVTGDRDAPARRIHVIKQKDDDPGPDILFKLKQVAIGHDEDGEEVTSCVVEVSDLAAGELVGKRKMSPKERIVIQSLQRVLVAKGIFPPPAIPDNVLDRARTGKVAILSGWRSEALSSLSAPDIDPDTARRTYDRARTSLQASKIIGVWEDWVWLG